MLEEDDVDLVNEAAVEHATVKDLIVKIEAMDATDEPYKATVTVLASTSTSRRRGRNRIVSSAQGQRSGPGCDGCRTGQPPAGAHRLSSVLTVTMATAIGDSEEDEVE